MKLALIQKIRYLIGRCIVVLLKNKTMKNIAKLTAFLFNECVNAFCTACRAIFTISFTKNPKTDWENRNRKIVYDKPGYDTFKKKKNDWI